MGHPVVCESGRDSEKCYDALIRVGLTFGGRGAGRRLCLRGPREETQHTPSSRGPSWAGGNVHFGSNALIMGNTEASVMGLFAGPDVEEMATLTVRGAAHAREKCIQVNNHN